MISKVSSFLLNKSNLPTPITCIPVWSPSSSVNGTNNTVTRGRNLENDFSCSLTFPIWYIIFYVYVAKGVHELLTLLPLLPKCWGCGIRYHDLSLRCWELNCVLCVLGNYSNWTTSPNLQWYLLCTLRVSSSLDLIGQDLESLVIINWGLNLRHFIKYTALCTRTVNCPPPCYHF